MSIWELFVIAVGLSMDAFAVSIGKGLSVSHAKWKHALCVGLWFGGFQALMPLIGYYLGVSFADFVSGIDHWIAFVLLGLIGGNMIRESFGEDEAVDASFGVKAMFLLAVATSIDALACGVSFAFLGIRILPAVLLIGCTTFVFSAAGLKLGAVVGGRFKNKAERIGGLVLIAMGIKILVEHLLEG